MRRLQDKTAIAFLAMLFFSVAQTADFSGVPRVVDGDTLVIGTTKFRMAGVDAPETDQVCLDARGARWTCGIDARDQLAAHISGRSISCVSSGTDRFGRTLATCSLGAENLNDWMVHDGRLKEFRILPLSGAQLVQTDETLSTGVQTGADPKRRRIEIRMRKSSPPG